MAARRGAVAEEREGVDMALHGAKPKHGLVWREPVWVGEWSVKELAGYWWYCQWQGVDYGPFETRREARQRLNELKRGALKKGKAQ